MNDVTVRPEVQLPNAEVKTIQDDFYAQVLETEFDEVLFGNSTETQPAEATIAEVTDENVNTTQNEGQNWKPSGSPTENLEEDKTSSDNETSFNFDISENYYILSSPPMKSLYFFLPLLNLNKYSIGSQTN